MAEAESPSLDPYRTLQLHPLAPRQLVANVYWTLTQRAQQTHASSPEAAPRVAELNEAYSILTDDGRRAAYDRAHGVHQLARPRIRVRQPFFSVPFFSQSKLIPEYVDYYHILYVQPDADRDVIEIAYRTLLGRTSDTRGQHAVMRDLLQDAYRTLGDRERRALYDEAHARRGRDSRARSIEEHHQSQDVSAQPELGTQAVALDKAGALEPTAPAFSNGHAAESSATHLRELVGDDASSLEVPSFLSRVPADLPTKAAAASASAAVVHEGEHAGDSPTAGLTSQPTASDTAVWPQRRLGLLDRLFARVSPSPDTVSTSGQAERTREELLEAEEDRLLALRSRASVGTPAQEQQPWPEPRPVNRAVAELFVSTGARAGQRVPLGERALILGGGGSDIELSDSPEHSSSATARIWQDRERFVFHQVGDGPVNINGEPLTLPLVFLDDGDEIELGTQRIVFRCVQPAN